MAVVVSVVGVKPVTGGVPVVVATALPLEVVGVAGGCEVCLPSVQVCFVIRTLVDVRAVVW